MLRRNSSKAYGQIDYGLFLVCKCVFCVQKVILVWKRPFANDPDATYSNVLAFEPLAVVLLDVNFVDEIWYVESIIGHNLSKLQVDLWKHEAERSRAK